MATLNPNSRKFGLSMQYLVMDLRYNHQVLFNKGVIVLDIQGHLANSYQDSTKRCSTSLLHTDLGRPVVLHVPLRLVTYYGECQTLLYVGRE